MTSLQAHPIHVKVLDNHSDDFHDTSGFSFREKLLLQNLVEEFASFHKFCDQIDVFAVLESVSQRNYIWLLTVPHEYLYLLSAVSFVFVNNL